MAPQARLRRETSADGAGTGAAAAVYRGAAARAGRRLCPCEARSRRKAAPARWCMSGASISPNSRWCWNRRSRSRTARRALYAGMTALTDALIAAAEPETAIAIAWPDAITVNRGLVGGGRLAWPQGVGEDEVPPWLVFGAMVRVQSTTGQEPGANPQVTALAEEGFSGVMSHEIVESFARHFMVAIDAWQESGFAAVAKTYFERFAAREGPAPRYRRQWRSAGAPHGERRASSASACCSAGRARPGSIRRPERRAHEAVAHHQARSVGHFRVRARRRAGRMGGVRRLRVLGRRSRRRWKARRARAFRSGFLGVDTLGWSTLVQIVEASQADRAEAGRDAGAAAGRSLRRARHGCRAWRGGRGGRLRRIAVRATAGHAGRGASHLRGRRVARILPHLAPARGAEARARFSFMEVEGEDEEEPGEEVSLIDLAERERK